jgi:Tfp pilus assembly protein PilN
MMLRINLLPPEALERRRSEKWYRYIFFGFFALLALALLVAAWLWLMAQTKQDTLQGLREQSQRYQAQAEAFSVFEKKQTDLVEREKVAGIALAGRVNMGRLADDVSLILPEEIWIEQLSVHQDNGLSMDGFTPLTSSRSSNVGYKSVAKSLVRLDSLDDLEEVWLNAASSGEFGEWQVESSSEVPTTSASVVRFQLSGRVKRDAGTPASVTAPGVTPTGGAD